MRCSQQALTSFANEGVLSLARSPNTIPGPHVPASSCCIIQSSRTSSEAPFTMDRGPGDHQSRSRRRGVIKVCPTFHFPRQRTLIRFSHSDVFPGTCFVVFVVGDTSNHLKGSRNAQGAVRITSICVFILWIVAMECFFSFQVINSR